MPLIFICVIFYLIGSFPTAYLLVKYKYKKNLTIEGSGNIGARNTFDVTHSKADGLIVLITDFLKGLLPVLWFLHYSGYDPETVMIPSIFLLAGHNFSIWLKFKGGRGLATGAGIMVAVNFTLVIIWLLFYSISNLLVKNVHIACVIALVLLPLSIIFLQEKIYRFSNPVYSGISDQFQFLFSFCSAICIVILIKHIEPVMEIIQVKKKN
ncbi:MAG TPA: glycerol-3-phosphate acyltransferase [Ignavibacteria bacterium]|nr:glycerol-3-phosphate acyltransferase [Ignavibacteria bacterium]